MTPKYRKLSLAELDALEQDFIYYLSSLGISAEQWQKHLQNDAEMVEKTIIAFSDLILEKAYHNCHLLEEVTRNGWLFYYFDDARKQINLLGITTSENLDIDLRKLTMEEILDQIITGEENSFRIIQASKPQQTDKAREIDRMLKRGAFLSQDQKLYAKLKDLAGEG